MVNFAKKRLQVFVSSTYTDLIEERQAAVEAILTAGHFPAGMELFTAGDESQMDAIKQWIDESDIYLLILGARYGSIEPKSGKSYTHLEYEYALQQQKPLFACVLTDEAIDKKVSKSGKSVLEMSNPDRLKEFRQLVMSKLVKMCSDAKDIKIASGETLASLARTDKLNGWVRADNHADMSVLADEIARLSRENALLRSQSAPKSEPPLIGGLTFDEITELLVSAGALKALHAMSDELLTYSGDDFGGKSGLKGPAELSEAVKVGVLSAEREMLGTVKYKVTPEGRTYLSKLKLAMLKHKKSVAAL
jgi:hypothetical protein